MTTEYELNPEALLFWLGIALVAAHFYGLLGFGVVTIITALFHMWAEEQ